MVERVLFPDGYDENRGLDGISKQQKVREYSGLKKMIFKPCKVIKSSDVCSTYTGNRNSSMKLEIRSIDHVKI